MNFKTCFTWRKLYMKLHERFERGVEFGWNPLRSAQIHRGEAEVDLSRPKWISVFKFTEGCSNPQRRSRGGFGQPEVNLNKPLARSQGSEARLNSPRRSQGEFNLAEDPWDRDKCFQMLRGLSICEFYFVLIPRKSFIDFCLICQEKISRYCICTVYFVYR